MAKVLLVEDDNNLREIYQARLMAEGYDIVTAQNGEEALVVAKQQKPDLIISDVMMPRISGFEMLDILRNTAELKHTKVIMLTALGQEDDQTRANSLGADKYLVKSQVTLEDIVTASKELLNGDGATSSASAPAPAEPPTTPSPVAPAAPSVPAVSHIANVDPPATPAPAAPGSPAPTTVQPANDPTASANPQPGQMPDPAATPAPSADPASVPSTATTPAAPEPTAIAPVTEPVAVQPEPVPTGPTTPAQPPSPAVVDKAAQGLEAEEAALQAQIASYSQSPSDATNSPSDAATPADPAQTGNDQALADAVKQLNAATPADPGTAPDLGGADANAAGRKVIQPISDPAAKPDLNALLAKEAPATPAAAPPTPQSPATGQTFDPNTSL